jgi:hypothetical protein
MFGYPDLPSSRTRGWEPPALGARLTSPYTFERQDSEDARATRYAAVAIGVGYLVLTLVVLAAVVLGGSGTSSDAQAASYHGSCRPTHQKWSGCLPGER